LARICLVSKVETYEKSRLENKIAAQFEVARELSVPLDWTLDVDSMTFRAPARKSSNAG